LGNETVRRYLPLLEAVFMCWRLQAWSTHLTTKVVQRPKIHLGGRHSGASRRSGTTLGSGLASAPLNALWQAT
jgi:hypothetical protein